MTTKQFATIATESYLPYTRMLYHSLMKSNPDAELTVFCNSELFPKLFGHSERLHFRVLPSIQLLGVKRAKFDVFAKMCGEPFTYLDSDVIVLDDLSCLFTGDMLAGCSDALDECSFIENRKYPWPGDPTLQNRRYCNSGVLFFPPTMRWFVESIRDLSRDDECWNRYIIPGRLYDNHFLCAMLNRFDVEFRPLDPQAFGWSGLYANSNWKVKRNGNHLVHQPSGRILHLVIFAYARDPAFWYARMPAWLAAFLQDKGSMHAGQKQSRKQNSLRPAKDDEAFAWEIGVLGTLGPFWVSGRYFVPVALVNRSNRDLGSSARINLSYHWRRANAVDDVFVFDGERSEIHPDLRPGESRRILCEILAPAEAGPYLLEWDLVEEGVTWFSAEGIFGPMREVEVLSFRDVRQ